MHHKSLTDKSRCLKPKSLLSRLSALRWQTNVSKLFNNSTQEKGTRHLPFFRSKDTSCKNQMKTQTSFKPSGHIAKCLTTSRDIMEQLANLKCLKTQIRHTDKMLSEQNEMMKKSLINCLSDPIPHPKAMTNHILLNEKSTSMSFPGSSEKEYNLLSFHHHSNKPSLLSRISLETSSSPNRRSLTHSSALSSQTQNGQIFSTDEQLTSTMSYWDYSPYPKSKATRRKSASSKSPLARRHQ